jgi:hypothetical protein
MEGTVSKAMYCFGNPAVPGTPWISMGELFHVKSHFPISTVYTA